MGADGEPGRGRIAVRPELVEEHLVAPLHARAMELLDGIDAPELLEGWPKTRVALAPEVGLNDDADGLARSLVRAGYAAREAELESFEAARVGVEWLAESIANRVERGEDPVRARRHVCVELALTEPDGRPSPDSGAASWRIPGPGAHVRHLVALRGADGLLGEGEEPPSGLGRQRDVKRCWLYGFLMRVGEESPT